MSAGRSGPPTEVEEHSGGERGLVHLELLSGFHDGCHYLPEGIALQPVRLPAKLLAWPTDCRWRSPARLQALAAAQPAASGPGLALAEGAAPATSLAQPVDRVAATLAGTPPSLADAVAVPLSPGQAPEKFRLLLGHSDWQLRAAAAGLATRHGAAPDASPTWPLERWRALQNEALVKLGVLGTLFKGTGWDASVRPLSLGIALLVGFCRRMRWIRAPASRRCPRFRALP